MRKVWRETLVSGVGAVALLGAVQAWQTRGVDSGRPLPELPLRVIGAQGEPREITLSQWRALHGDRPVALYLWAEWCSICKAQEGLITGLMADHPVMTVALRSGDEARVRRHLAQRQLNWPTAVDAAGEVGTGLGFAGVPAFMVIDAQGRVRMPTVGLTTPWGMRWRLWWVGWMA